MAFRCASHRLSRHAGKQVLSFGHGDWQRGRCATFPGGSEGAWSQALPGGGPQAVIDGCHVGAMKHANDGVLGLTRRQQGRTAFPVTLLASDTPGSLDAPCDVPRVFGIEGKAQGFRVGGPPPGGDPGPAGRTTPARR